MKILCVPGKKGRGMKFVYGAVVDRVFVGLAAKDKDTVVYPTIDLFYHLDTISTVLRLAQEMKKKGLLPRVYFEESGANVYISVLFRIKNISHNLIEEVFNLHRPELKKEELELFMTGETELKRKEVEPFLDYFNQIGYFYVHLAKRQNDKINLLWEAKLTSLEKGPPGKFF